jgi:sugar lactone lactonase YvrE
MAVLCLGLGAYAIPPLHPQFVAAQSVVPSGSLSYPYRCAVDSSGNVYISDTQSNAILKETLAANGTYTESVVVSTGLATPYGIAVDSSGNVYIADNGHNRIVKATPSGSSYTISVVTTTTTLSYPTGIAADASGNLYIADTGGGKILVEAPSGSSYTETSLTYSSNFAQITGIAVDSTGNIFVSDIDNDAVYEEAYSAGSYTPSTVPTSGLSYPYDLAVDASDNLYISDFTHKRIVEETYSGGSYTQSVFPTYNLGGALGVAVDQGGNLYIADTFGFNIKTLTLSGGSFGPVNVASNAGPIYMLFDFVGGADEDTVTLSGTAVLTQGATGLDFTDSLTGNCALTSYSAGNVCALGVNLTPAVPGSRVGAAQLIGSAGVLAQGSFEATGVGPQINFFAASDFFEFDVIRVAGSFSPYDLTNPFDAAVDAGGNVYVVDYNNNTVYMEALSAGSFTQSVVASGLNNPEAVAVDGAGNVYIVDSGNNQILKETNFGGTWTGTAVLTGLDFPAGVAVDWLGNLYFSSFSDNAVYKATLSQGVYSSPSSLSFAGLLQPRKIAVDGSGNVYVADTGNSRVVMETLSGGSYTQTTLGSGMHYPYGVAVDASGSVYVADTINSRILKESLVGGTYTQSVLIPGPPAYGIVLDGQGNLYFPDPADATVFKISYNTLPSLSFADSNLGVQSSDSPESFSVINTGNAALSIQVPESGTNPSVAAGYTLDAGTTCPDLTTGSSTGSVPAGSTCTYEVDFIPQAVGLDAGTLILSDNNLNLPSSTQSISLTGTGNTIPTTTAVSSATTGYSPNLQTVTLSASVTSGDGTVNAGTVTFTVLAGSTAVGSPATSSTLSAGMASVGYSLPAGTAAGAYSIQAVFNAGGSFATSSNAAQTLTVSKAAQTISFTAPATPVTYSPGLVIPLSATGGVSGNAIVFSVDGSSTGTGTIAGSSLTVTGAGTLVIDANQASNGNYSAATQAQATVVVNKAGQTIDFTAPASPRTYAPGLVILLSATGGVSDNAIVFTLDGSSTGTGTIAGNSLTLTGAGTLVIDANQTGNGNYSAATQAQATVVVNKAAQSIDFTAPASPRIYTPGLVIPLSATGGASGNTIVFSFDGSSTGTGTITGSSLNVTGAGTLVIDANQTGNGNYSAAPQAHVTVVVTKTSQTIDFTAPATPRTYSPGLAISLSATGGASGNTIVFSLDASSTGTGAIAGNSLTVTGAGTLVIDANQTGNGNYSAAAQAQATVVVNKAAQNIDFTAPGTPVTYSHGLIIPLIATGGASGNAIVFSLDASSTGTGTIAGNSLTVTGAGTLTIDANQASNGNYSAAAQAQVTVVVGKIAQTISFTAPASPVTYGVIPIALVATGGTSGNAVTFSVTGPANVSGSTLTITGAGTVIITANQAANVDYAAATAVEQTILVKQAASATSLSSSVNPIVDANPTTLTATVTSPAGTPTGTVSFLDGATPLGDGTLSDGVATLMVSSLPAGAHTITAAYGGDANFAASMSGALAVSASGFTVSASASGGGASQTVAPGGVATYTLDIVPSSGTSLPTLSTLTLTGMPAGATATVTPSTWTELSGNSWSLPANTTLTQVTVAIRVPAETAALERRNLPNGAIPCILLGLLLLPFAGRMREAGKRLGRALSVLLLMAAGAIAIAGLSGCGSTTGFFGQQQKTYTVTETVTSGAFSHSTTVTLTVQ